MQERELQKQAMEYLKRAVPKGFFFRVESGTHNRKGAFRGWGMGKDVISGIPDILGCIQGRFVGIELKTKYGTLRPAQKVFRDRLESKGGLYFVVKTMEELEAAVAAATNQHGVKPKLNIMPSYGSPLWNPKEETP